ncbi:23S rRNA (guanine(745)-N(1))-methyltransferase [Dictyobacter alpinus]|uniref:23S rRNA (Guanine(745)-N(1))-methyltransferase n=2 Tax=Dictyobacter alpinus TaxID=2014873 RepID=A0A402B532_9CHLR|nr:23S rRNA (guanine(745)-N(1))-methyltransferase [Dictyobacter alpinus]
MLQARRAFFDKAYYEPLSNTLNELMLAHLAPTQAGPVRILDAGCGEGYYLGQMQQALAPRFEHIQGLGIDISKDAIRMAARRYPTAFFMVANLNEPLPLADQALAGMLNIFAPRNVAEYTRVLAPGAPLIIVIPGAHHLQELRQTLQLLNIEENKQQHVADQFSDSFTFVTTRALSYELALQQPEIEQIVMMTPNYWHLSEEIRARMTALRSISTTVDFKCLVFQRS